MHLLNLLNSIYRLLYLILGRYHLLLRNELILGLVLDWQEIKRCWLGNLGRLSRLVICWWYKFRRNLLGELYAHVFLFFIHQVHRNHEHSFWKLVFPTWIAQFPDLRANPLVKLRLKHYILHVRVRKKSKLVFIEEVKYFSVVLPIFCGDAPDWLIHLRLLLGLRFWVHHLLGFWLTRGYESGLI